jgi:predicted ester cyclase
MSRKMSSRLVGSISVLLMLAAFTTPIAAQDDNPLPAPTGPYAVGVQWRHWVDESRDETFGPEPHGKREMMVAFFYPAAASDDQAPEPYLADADRVLPAFASGLALVGLELSLAASDIAGFQSYAVPDAPLSDDQATYPVLVFSPGASADLRMYTAQLEELASQGYIVAAINHAYGISGMVFPDGRAAPLDFSLGFEGTASLWSQDQIFVIDQLELINASDPENLFANRLDLEHLGVFGQSLGGSAATMTCFADDRCKAEAIGDSPIYGEVLEQGLEQPVLYMLSDSRFVFPAAIRSDPAYFEHSTGPYYAAAFEGFKHLDFGDFPLWQSVEPLREAQWMGSVEPERAVELTRAYLVAFFDKYLKGATDTLLDVPSDANPEVTIQTGYVASPADMQTGLSEEDAMAFAEQFNAIFDGPQLEIADEIMAEEFVGHLPLAPELDRQGWKDYVASFYVGISDLKEEVNEVIVGEDRVVLYVSYTGTHDGPLFGIPATGNAVTFDGIGIFRFDEDGRAVENWAVVDVVGLMAQIGAFPPEQ